MYAIIVWISEDSPVPSVIGPYDSDLAFEDANVLRAQCHKVQVCNLNTPENCHTLGLAKELTNG